MEKIKLVSNGDNKSGFVAYFFYGKNDSIFKE